MSSILNENTHHEDDFEKDAVYKEKCEVLFSILKKCCAEGMALYKIKKFDESKDGHKAWRRLCDHYHAFGDVNTYATSLMNQLINLKLEANMNGSVEKYIADFESLLLKLEEAKNLVPEQIAISIFLSGIRDRNYSAFKTMCMANPTSTLDTLIITLRRENYANNPTGNTTTR